NASPATELGVKSIDLLQYSDRCRWTESRSLSQSPRRTQCCIPGRVRGIAECCRATRSHRSEANGKPRPPRTYPPFLLIHGDKDKYIPYTEYTNLQTALRKVGVQCGHIAVLPQARIRTALHCRESVHGRHRGAGLRQQIAPAAHILFGCRALARRVSDSNSASASPLSVRACRAIPASRLR